MATKPQISINELFKGTFPDIDKYKAIVGIDVHTTPGVVQCSPLSTENKPYRFDDIGLSLQFPDNEYPIQFEEYNGVMFCLTNDDRVMQKNTQSSEWIDLSYGEGGSVGIFAYKGYLFVNRNGNLDYSEIDESRTTSNPTWTLNWQSGLNWTDFLWDTSDFMYLAVGNQIVRIQEEVGQTFDPSNSATYSVITSNLIVKEDINRILEANGLLYIITDNAIHPWDGLSTYSQSPKYLNEKIEVSTVLYDIIYCLTEHSKKILQFNGASFKEIGSFPERYGSVVSKWAITTYRDSVFIGFRVNESSQFSVSGIYQITPNGAVSTPYIASTGTVDDDMLIYALHGYKDDRDIMYAGWRDATLTRGGIDYTDIGFNKYDSYDESYIISGKYILGTKDLPSQLNKVSINLNRDLTDGDGVKIEYRETEDDSWKEIVDMNYTDFGGVRSTTKDFAFSKEQIQFKISLKSDIQILSIIFI